MELSFELRMVVSSTTQSSPKIFILVLKLTELDRFRKGKRISSLLRARVSGSVGVLLHEGFKL